MPSHIKRKACGHKCASSDASYKYDNDSKTCLLKITTQVYDGSSIVLSSEGHSSICRK